MSLSLDHLVIHVSNLEQAIADYTALGFTVQRGGHHVGGATHNALVGFADGSYLELIAFRATDPTHPWARHAAAGYEGFVDFALWPDDIARVIQEAGERQLPYAGPQPGGRQRPDGEALAWQIGEPPNADLPFLCGDVTPRHLRVPEGAVRVHPNGVQGVAAVTVLVHDVQASLARYQALLGTAVVAHPDVQSLPGLGLRFASVALGPWLLVLLSPLDDGEHAAALALHETLAARGEGVFGVALRARDTQATHTLPLHQSHGAHIEVHPV